MGWLGLCLCYLWSACRSFLSRSGSVMIADSERRALRRAAFVGAIAARCGLRGQCLLSRS